MASNHYPPGPAPKPIIGNLLDFQRDPLGFLTRMGREYGDIAHFSFPGYKAVFVNRPEWIKAILVDDEDKFIKSFDYKVLKMIVGEGLLTSEGAFHMRQRRLIQPAFHRKRLAGYAQTMIDYTLRMRERWCPGEAFDVAQEMMRLTLAIVARALLSADVEGSAREVGDAVTALMKMAESPLMIVAPWLMNLLPTPGARASRKAAQTLDSIVYRIIHERRESESDRGDLISILMLARDEEAPDGANGAARMTDQQVRDEVMTIFLAGHETTANMLAWTWYLLSQHPEVEARVHGEIDAVLGGRDPMPDDVPRLRYINMVLAEALRLYPPAWAIGRQTIGEYRLGDYTLPAGTQIVLSPYVTQRDPRNFHDPLTFDPERWGEGSPGRKDFSYFPFGGGPRICIGEMFALIEGALVIATIAQRYRLKLVEGHPIDLQPMVTLRPRHGVRVVPEERVDGMHLSAAATA